MLEFEKFTKAIRMVLILMKRIRSLDETNQLLGNRSRFCFYTFAALTPSVLKAQATETLARYGASDSVEKLVQITMEDLRVTLILMAVAGVVLVISGALILRRIRFGWKLLLAYFALELIARSIQIVLLQGAWPIVIGGLVYGTLLWKVLRLQKTAEYEAWWGNGAGIPNAWFCNPGTRRNSGWPPY